MRFLLESDHYVDDRVLEKGNEVGDGEGSIHPWRYAKDQPRDGVKAGQARPPSMGMSPLDQEARNLFQKKFGHVPPGTDPTLAIPIQGTDSKAKAPPLVVPTKGPPPQPPKTPDPAIATVPPKATIPGQNNSDQAKDK